MTSGQMFEQFILDWVKDPADRAAARRDLESLISGAVKDRQGAEIEAALEKERSGQQYLLTSIEVMVLALGTSEPTIQARAAVIGRNSLALEADKAAFRRRLAGKA